MFSGSKAVRPKWRSKPRRGDRFRQFRLRLETLEDRLALSAAPIQVTTTADVVDPNDGLTSLREAIQQANAAATPQTIDLPVGQYQLSSAAGELYITNSVTIEGAGAMSTEVDGGGHIRVFHIDGDNVSVSLSGLTIQGGNANGDGGGILDTATVSQLMLTDCMVNGNSASGAGGGIDEAAGTSTLTLNGCTIANNTAGGNGGGIDVASNETASALTNCTIYGNTAAGSGGALADDSSGGAINLLNDTIDGNSSGVFQQHATISISNTIVAQNGRDVVGNFGGSFIANGVDLIGTSSHPVDPRLGPLADNGGTTLTQALLPDSPAIGMGARKGAPDVDQRGVARPDGIATDIGAYEFAPPTPAITQATSEARAGGSQPAWVGGQTLFVHGTGFYPNSILRVNGQDVRTVFEGPTELRAMVGDLMIKGLTSYSVTVFTPGGGESSSVDVQVAAPPPPNNPTPLPIKIVPPIEVLPPVENSPPVSTQPSPTPNPPAASGGTNAQFATAVYQDLLKRAPDASGLSHWSDFLDHGGSRSQFVGDLLASREYLADQVQTLFQTYLHRSADPGATDYFVSFLAAGGSPDRIAAVLAGSPEYSQMHGASADGFIDALFHDALGRAADPTSLAFFEHELNAGVSRQRAAAQIFASDEYRRDEVNQFYVEFLGRQADAQALDHFAAGLSHGLTERELIQQIAASDEFFSKATS